MSHTRTSAKTAAIHGSFAFSCYDYAGELFRTQDGFATAQEADRAAEQAERDMMMALLALSPEVEAMHASISDEELLRELGL